jgi:glucose 1-dehydrogenase
MMRLENQVAIISGAGSGIGKATALRFAREGADIVIVYHRNDENAQKSARMIEELGRKVLVCKADVGNVPAFREVVDKTFETFNRVDILVNNAGVFIPTPLLEMTEEVWYETLDTNLKAALFCTQAVARYWVEEGRGGKVINIGSVHATRSWPNNTAYASSRAGLRGLTMLMAQELAPYKINVNMVSPGLIATRIPREWWEKPEFRERAQNEIALKRMGEPEEVAGLVFFLACNDGDYVTGSEYIMDGGLLLYSYSI